MLVRAQGRAVRIDVQHLEIPPRGEVRRSEHHAPLLWIRLWIDGLEMMLAITVTENNPFDKLFGDELLFLGTTAPRWHPKPRHRARQRTLVRGRAVCPAPLDPGSQPQDAAGNAASIVAVTGAPSTVAEAVRVMVPAAIAACLVVNDADMLLPAATEPKAFVP
ncbi:hypothetical protein FBY39_1305 [Microbacterium sp. SLBN-146]|nr:hypothetical protein FBY39_1305 [Microbacterium sp. SLBN-146]